MRQDYSGRWTQSERLFHILLGDPLGVERQNPIFQITVDRKRMRDWRALRRLPRLYVARGEVFTRGVLCRRGCASA